MNDLKQQVEFIEEELSALHQEMERGLYSDEMNQLSPQMKALGYESQLKQLRERIFGLMNMLQEKLAQLKGFGRTAPMDKAELSQEIAEIQGLISQLLDLAGRLEDMIDLLQLRLTTGRADASSTQTSGGFVQAAAGQVKSWLAVLMKWIKRISGQLWRLLSGLLTPREWKIGADIGTGPFGLANAKIEITFGP